MQIDLEGRRVRMSVGEFSEFTLGPQDGGEGPAGIWRAQLGTRWHQQMQHQAALDYGTVRFEVPVAGRLPAGRWVVELAGRIDQWVDRTGARALIREIKTVSRPLPEGADVLRQAYPGYFAQLAAYVALQEQPTPDGELVFVEISTGLSQSVACGPADELRLQQQLARIQEFLEVQWRARERVRRLQFRPAFAAPRPGQETTGLRLAEQANLGKAVLLEAPTGFGKTGVLLEFALGRLRSGGADRVLYLTGKATGQVQVMRTLQSMSPPMAEGGPAVWLVRPKPEHCVNREYHCVREACRFLDGIEERWNASGLARFYLLDDQPRDLASLRAAGLDARICPYEITRAALAGNEVWIGDFNYVFSPGSRGLFYHQPGFDPGRTLLIIDEAHNLPGRVADAYSHQLAGGDAELAGTLLRSLHPLARVASLWREWVDLLQSLGACPALNEDTETSARELIGRIGTEIRETPIDYGALSPRATETLWAVASLADDLVAQDLPRLWWCRTPGVLSITCLDAAPVIGATLAEYNLTLFATATPGPVLDFSASCGLLLQAGELPAPGTIPPRLGELTKRQTRSLAKNVLSGTDLLRRAEQAEAPIRVLAAETPWREGAYDVVVDLRVNTAFQQRNFHARTTALALEALVGSAGPAVGFFPSYAYAAMIAAELQALAPALRVGLQPRSLDLAAQTTWMEAALTDCSLLLLVLGTGFSEGIDLLGGRVTRALVAGPALPEVNPVQRARLAAWAPLGRDVAVRRTYQIPGMQKVNQALGRLVRAPGQRAKVVLHCRRFAEKVYQELLEPAYRDSRTIETDEDLSAWLNLS